ncbi:S8 family serine peptidase [Clostridium nigeriense]|uniref:S8 family serine peptidase n=1 Tax=Clostridium nigeriense TaxID=1805470 RepID=UPI003D351C1F
MKRNKLKGIIGIALAVSLGSNSLIYAKANTTDNSEYAKLLSSIKKGNLIEEASSASKISTDIDLESDEVVSVIVEFVSEPLAVSNEKSLFKLSESKVERDHRVFETFLGNMPQTYSDTKMEIKEEYYTVFNGVAMNIKSSELEALIKCEVVKKIHKDYEVRLENVDDEGVEDESSSTSNEIEEIESTEPIIEENELTNEIEIGIEGNEVEEIIKSEEEKSEEIIKSEEDKHEAVSNEISPLMMDSVPFLDIDDLHEDGVKGDGVKVGVLDTGIDYNHPDLTDAYRGFTSNDGDANNQDIESIKGWDFIDNDADPMETTYSDWKESGQQEFDYYGNAYYTSHGTHVSGTIAGQAANTETDNAVLGVAPNVELYGYRVLGPRGSGATSGIIAGIEKAVNDGMDVINMSLGDAGTTDPFSPMVTAVNNATLAGVVTVIANGNSGPSAATSSAPGTAQLPITVGASSVDYKVDAYKIALNGLEINSQVMVKNLEVPFSAFENTEYEVVYCALGSEEEFNELDVEGKVALIDRGTSTFVQKLQNAKAAGAAFVIIANNVTDSTMPYIGESTSLNTLALSLEDGKVLKENLDKKITITASGSFIVEGDKLTDFSSAGPVKRTYEIRPDVVAPGSQVFSTVPEYINDKNEDEDNYKVAYERMSGTSMAAPHVAGIAALILQANPDYTPEDVKAAIMNTSEKIIKEDGSDYSVHQIGAGRVNPYEAVYEDVSFKAEYEVIAGEKSEKYDNVTGMLSYGKVYKNEDNSKDTEKVIPVTVSNNSSERKTYNVSVHYSNSDRAVSAEENNVKLNVLDKITLDPGESKGFDAEIILPGSASNGTYEGYILFQDTASNEDYQMPFSATLSIEGFSILDYPSMYEGVSKGLSAFNTSSLFNKSEYTFFAGSDITVTMAVSEPVSVIHTFIKDKTTGEYIGHAGSQDGSWIPEDYEVLIPNIMPGGLVSKIVNGNVTGEKIAVQNGIYDLEVVVETYEGKTFSKTIPMAVINDTNSDELTFNFNEGIIEVTDDLYSSEVWYDGEEHEGIWIKANVFNEYVDKLKNEYGLDYLKQEELNGLYANGYYPNGKRIAMSVMAKENGDVVIAGIEKNDLKDGFFKVKLEYANAATVTDIPHNFIFVNKDTQYLSLDTNLERVTENDSLIASISLNNAKDVTEGTFVIENYGNADLGIESVTPTKELKAILNENKESIDINFEEISTDNGGQAFQISFKLDGKNIIGLNDSVKLFDVNYKVNSLEGIEEDLIDDEQFRYMNLRGISGEFKNSSGDLVNVQVGTMDKNLLIESTEKTLIYGTTITYTRGMSDAKVYAIDPDGNKYEPTYFMFDEMLERGHLFAFNDLPIIEGNYKIILETPGGFDSIVDVPGSRLNKDDERIGNIFAITSYSFTSSTPLQSKLGDVNEDGAIDILDAVEIAKVYVPTIFDDEMLSSEASEISEERVAADLTQDGIVNYIDMNAVIENYLMKDYLNEGAKEPQEVYNGNDLYDILEECGYFDEQPELNVTLEADKYELKAGETLNLTATPPTDEVEFEYEFSVRGQNDDEWTVIQDRSDNRSTSWTPEEAGSYAVKVRIFYDEISYIWQDNKIVTVNKNDVVDPEEPENPGDGDDNGNNNNGNNPQNPDDNNGSSDGNNDGIDKPSIDIKPDDTNKPTTDNGKLPQTGGASSLMTLILGVGTTIGGAIAFKKKK